MKKSYIVMGVSGCGKSTVGKKLSTAVSLPFFDGDDFHPKANIDKMKSGSPLNDDDRQPWLETLTNLISESQTGCIIACSALKQEYRNTLRNAGDINFIYLEGSREILLERLKTRAKNSPHFMPSTLLDSQLTTLESPTGEANTLTIDISQSIEQITQRILDQITFLKL